MKTPGQNNFDAFFTTQTQPYYIYTPDYRQNSAGIRCLHYLCHALNEQGFEAYIFPATTVNPYLHTHRLTKDIVRRHFISGRHPIAVYPEIATGNPLHTHTVARWLLNRPGHLGGDTTYPESDLLFYFDIWTLPDGMEGDLLRLPTVDTRIFNNENNEFDSHRTGICYYANKFLKFGGTVRPEFIEHGTSLCQDIPRTHEEIAAILRKSETLYCYEQSAIIQEALACGCAVVIVSTDYWETSKWRCRPIGVRLDTDTDNIALVNAEIAGYREHIEEEQNSALAQLDTFIRKTQAVAHSELSKYPEASLNFESSDLWLANRHNRPHLSGALDLLYAEHFSLGGGLEKLDFGSKPLSSEKNSALAVPYQKWLANRAITQCDIDTTVNMAKLDTQPTFLFLLRVSPEQSAAIADTLDSLISQFYGHWLLDIFTTIEAPQGLEGITCIGWHVIADTTDEKYLSDNLVSSRATDFVVELPPGARLDPLYLWRLAREANAQPDARAFFVDDDCCDESGRHHGARFKPGCNPAALQSSDLAGPLCIQRDVWLTTGGASQRIGSPWFAKLLDIAMQFGWETIKHVPDVLITYPDNFPTDLESCLLGLTDRLEKHQSGGEIVPVSGQSWTIRYPLPTNHGVTIAILSQGHLDLLISCFNSIVDKTTGSDFEILMLCPSLADDPDLAAWLIAAQQNATVSVRIIQNDTLTNHAARCNAAVDAAKYDFVLLVREEVLVIQAQWLDELTRICMQPGVAAAAPRFIQPGTGLLENAGNVIGLMGNITSPYQGEAAPDESGYLDSLKISRDVSTLPEACMLVKKAAYLAVGGMDDEALGDHLADADLSLKLRNQGHRLLYQPQSTVVFGGKSRLAFESDQAPAANETLRRMEAEKQFHARWEKQALIDPFWNPCLSLGAAKPTLEADYRAPWQYLPGDTPRLFAHSLTNGQGVIRVVEPLRAARKQGLAMECIWLQQGTRQPTAAELERIAPDTAIVQHYIYDRHLSALHAWKVARVSPFVVYTIDDLITDMDETNPARVNIPANSRARLKYALAHCDRLVTSTDFLADYCKSFISDIRVVPNRLDPEIWLPLTTQKRTATRPRVGWAGGQTHLRDLLILKEVIERTRHEVDWVFFGMCPDEIRPFLAEYHPFSKFSTYPAHLASLNLDLAVAPLAQIPFNQAKSNLRLLEYGILGIPVVCTDIDPYQNSPACCVENNPGAWIEALRARIYDADAREREGTTIKSWVQERFLLESKHLKGWLEAHLSP